MQMEVWIAFGMIVSGTQTYVFTIQSYHFPDT
jgi:hypothetical protein